jgi:hypothetical protein
MPSPRKKYRQIFPDFRHGFHYIKTGKLLQGCAREPLFRRVQKTHLLQSQGWQHLQEYAAKSKQHGGP